MENGARCSTQAPAFVRLPDQLHGLLPVTTTTDDPLLVDLHNQRPRLEDLVPRKIVARTPPTSMHLLRRPEANLHARRAVPRRPHQPEYEDS
eukprot:7844244-Pyramimonas_sp.AAC.1